MKNEKGNTSQLVFTNNFYPNNELLEEGDKIIIKDSKSRKVEYEVYDIYEVNYNDASFMTRDTEGRTEISIETGGSSDDKRLIICAKEMQQFLNLNYLRIQ